MLIKLDTTIIFHLLYFFLTKILCCIFRLKYCIYLFWKNVLYLLVDIFIIFICLPGANGTIEMIDFRKSRDLIWNLRNTSHATTTIFIPFLNQIKIKIEDSKSHNSLIESKKQKQWKTTASMEAILVDSVQNSLRHFLHSNAIFLSHRLCAQFPSEVLKIQFFIAFLDHTLIWIFFS